MPLVGAPPNIERAGVVCGFLITPSQAGLIAYLYPGVLFAQGQMWRPGAVQNPPGVPASQQSWLFYDSSAGLYWANTPVAANEGDAFIGWVLANGEKILAVSRQEIWLPEAEREITVVPLGTTMPQGPGQGFDESIPVPDVQYFNAGTVETVEGVAVWTPVMQWDTLHKRMLIDWGVLAPADRTNWSGVAMWIGVPKPGGGSYYADTSGFIALASFGTLGGSRYYYGQHAVEPQDIPDPPETWRCIAVSYSRAGEPKLDAEGNPIGPYVDLPTLPAWGQLSGLAATIGEYGYDQTTVPSQPVARVDLTWTNPADADENACLSFWTYSTDTSVTDPPDAGKFRHAANKGWEVGNSTVDIWAPRPKQGDPTERLWVRGVLWDKFFSGPPTNDSPVTYVDITAPGVPPQLTGFSIDRIDTAGPSPSFKLQVNYTRPAGLEFFYAALERIGTDSDFNPLAGNVWGKSADIGSAATPGVPTSETFPQSGLWTFPDTQAYYYQYRAVSISRAGLRNDTAPPTANVTVPAVGTIQGSVVVNIPTASFAAGIKPVELVAALPGLPSGDYPVGTPVCLTTAYPQPKLYRVNNAGTDWTAMTEGTDITIHTIHGADYGIYGQIAVGAVGATEMVAQEIRVGRGGGKPTRFTVIDSWGQMAAFLGDWFGDYLNWFRNVSIGPNLAIPIILGNETGLTITDASIKVTAGNTIVLISPTTGLSIEDPYSKMMLTGSLLQIWLNSAPTELVQVYPSYVYVQHSAGFAGFFYADVWGGRLILFYDSAPNVELSGSPAGGYLKINQQQVVQTRQAAVADASGGTTVDAEARAAINALLARIRTHGLIAT